MSVREEDRQRNCPSRGLGIAAAAIGVGVGAALYYFFNKRSENPNGEGSTSNWSCEQPHALRYNHYEEDDSYTTISENSTSDTSMHDTSADSTNTDYSMSSRDNTDSITSYSDMSTEIVDTSDSDASTESELEMSVDNSDLSPHSDITQLSSAAGHFLRETAQTLRNVAQSEDGYLSVENSLIQSPVQSNSENRFTLPYVNVQSTNHSDSDVEWDITPSSVDLPSDHRRSPIMTFLSACSPRRRKRLTEQQQMSLIRDQAFRERSWSLEECSICFDVMLRTQEVMALPCTHRFHQQCILPWLQEKQTCPNCRKQAECKTHRILT